MAYQYFNRQGSRITREEWDKLMSGPDRTLRMFDNGKVRVMLQFDGAISPLAASSFRDTWPLFRMSVQNYDAKGFLRPDPIDGMTFPNEVSAIDGYQDFLQAWADCCDDNGMFVEKDNLLAPPPPPDPDEPQSVLKGQESFTPW